MGAAEMGGRALTGSGSVRSGRSLADLHHFVTGAANVWHSNAAQRMAATETPQFAPLYLKAATGGQNPSCPRNRPFYLTALRVRGIFLLGRAFHGRIRPGLAAESDDRIQARLRGFDLLLVDDIQFIIGKASAQEELLYTIDALLAEGKRLRSPPTAPAGARCKGGAALAQLSVDGAGRRYPARRYRERCAILNTACSAFRPPNVLPT